VLLGPHHQNCGLCRDRHHEPDSSGEKCPEKQEAVGTVGDLQAEPDANDIDGQEADSDLQEAEQTELQQAEQTEAQEAAPESEKHAAEAELLQDAQAEPYPEHFEDDRQDVETDSKQQAAGNLHLHVRRETRRATAVWQTSTAVMKVWALAPI
jgi:hypothetical protein